MGGSSGPTKTESVVTQTNLPEYLKGPVLDVIGRAQGVADQPYTPFPYQRIAGFTPAEQQVQQNVLGMQAPNQFAFGSGLAAAAGQASLNQAQYNPAQFTAQQVGGPQLTQYSMGAAQTGFQPNLEAFQMGPTRDVGSQAVGAPSMQGAQTGFGQQPLEQFRMAGPEMFGTEQAQRYMSPFIQQALEPQMREAVTSAQRAQLAQDLGAARQGTYGGSRQLLAATERERNLGQQLGDIQARGMESAFAQAQQQFERDRAAGMTTGQQNLQAALQQQQLGTQTGLQAALANLSNEQQARVNNQAMQFQAQGMNAENALRAALANQGVDVTRAQANQQAALGVQQLGTQTGLQAALANLDARSQANVQNLAAQLQTQGLSSEQALRAALANQQASLEAQSLGEQSRQFGAGQGLAALGQAGQLGQTLGNLGQYQQQADLSRLQAQQQAAAMPRTLEQQQLDMQYQDFLRQRDYPMEQLGFLSSVIRGIPFTPSSAQTTYRAPTDPMSYLGAGLGNIAARSIVG
jgi:hypothetical protein